ncbi:MAG: IgGFc-binding protein [Myxococcales bacterium]|nr:IgGFc-binding protein [Myxococcales bacterium]
MSSRLPPRARRRDLAGRGRPWRIGLGLALLGGSLGASACFDTATRWFLPEPLPPPCEVGVVRCGVALERCEAGPGGIDWQVLEDCPAAGKVCAAGLLACTDCLPGTTTCDGADVVSCGADGTLGGVLQTCDPALGSACRGGSCSALCAFAAAQKSNVGCEYWAVDLDNARIDESDNAAAQQFAVVVSNPQPDVPAKIRIFQNDGLPGGPSPELLIAEVVIAPLNLRVLKLGPREVDGSADGTFDTGTHTALSRHAYKIASDFPVVAYQFNPLENVSVFSNDASLLKPREALGNDSHEMALAYVAVGWPQTIAITDDPETNFSAQSPIALRAFLTIVATADGTTVRVTPATRVVPGGPVAATPAGGLIEVALDAYDVLNLESDDFNGDFTGSFVEANAPVAVFSGGEASDAPHFESLSERRCCADHLEEQLDPIRTAGKLFALPHTPSRTAAVALAGAAVGVGPEPEYVRFVATRAGATHVTTTLPPPDDAFDLVGPGAFREVTAWRDFTAEASEPVHVAQIMASQDATGVPRALPGGDPSLVVVPPREQYRTDYVFLTPDKYAFDFVSIVVPTGAQAWLDGANVSGCESAPADGLTPEERGQAEPDFYTYRCQLSFPTIDPDSGLALPGVQNDGVHRIVADHPVGVFVTGFDSFVSYGYAAGTELHEIAPPR